MDKINHDRNKKKDSTKIGMDSIGHDRNKKKTDSTQIGIDSIKSLYNGQVKIDDKTSHTNQE